MEAPAPRQVRVGVGVFVLRSPADPSHNPVFLLGQRLNSHGAGTWALPGGHLHFGETPEHAARREVLEETGLHVRNCRFLTATNDYMPEEGRHYITLLVVCERVDGGAVAERREVDKCRGWEWVSWGDLVRWVEEEEAEVEAQRTGTGTGAGMGIGEEIRDRRAVFGPLVSLVRQRAGVVPGL